MLKPLLQHKQHGHHNQSHVDASGLPLPGLILRHPDMTLGILKSSLDPEALRLHARQFYDTRLGRGVAQTIFDSARRANLPSDDQMPAVRCRTVSVQQPYSALQSFDNQLSLRGAAQGLPAPSRCRLFLHSLSHLDRLRAAVITHAGTALALWRQVRRPIVHKCLQFPKPTMHHRPSPAKTASPNARRKDRGTAAMLH